MILLIKLSNRDRGGVGHGAYTFNLELTRLSQENLKFLGYRGRPFPEQNKSETRGRWLREQHHIHMLSQKQKIY
jgi:hypothetical protein